MPLFVAYVPDTGHVVGAVDSIGAPPLPPRDPSGIVPAGSLVGTALQLRVSLDDGEIAIVSVPVGELAAHTPDDEPNALTDPLAFGVEQVQGQAPKPALVLLRPWTGGIQFTTNGLALRVTLPQPNQTQITTVVAFVTDGQDTRMVAGDIQANQTVVELPVAVDDGPHGVLVLATGWAGRLEAVTKT